MSKIGSGWSWSEVVDSRRWKEWCINWCWGQRREMEIVQRQETQPTSWCEVSVAHRENGSDCGYDTEKQVSQEQNQAREQGMGARMNTTSQTPLQSTQWETRAHWEAQNEAKDMSTWCYPQFVRGGSNSGSDDFPRFWAAEKMSDPPIGVCTAHTHWIFCAGAPMLNLVRRLCWPASSSSKFLLHFISFLVFKITWLQTK